MRIFYVGNNYNGYRVLKWLKGRGENIVGISVHPDKKALFKEEIISVSGLSRKYIIDGSTINEPGTVKKINALKPDFIISINFDYILKKDILDITSRGAVNLHTSYLPYNKGNYPNVWSIVENTPAGVTLHYMDERVDTGEIINQVEVIIDITDTGKTLYKKLENAAFKLFKKNWDDIKSGKNKKFKQVGTGTYHKKRDVIKIDPIDPEKYYKAIDLINILRARTFPPYKGAYLDINGRKIYMRIKLYEE